MHERCKELVRITFFLVAITKLSQAEQIALEDEYNSTARCKHENGSGIFQCCTMLVLSLSTLAKATTFIAAIDMKVY